MKRLPRGELESRVMNVLWDASGPLTSRDVHAAVATPRRPLAVTTVTTILVRLWEKGMLDRELVGRGYSYRAATSREDWTVQRMNELLDASTDRRAALQQFVHSISGREASTLQRLLDERRRR